MNADSAFLSPLQNSSTGTGFYLPGFQCFETESVIIILIRSGDGFFYSPVGIPIWNYLPGLSRLSCLGVVVDKLVIFDIFGVRSSNRYSNAESTTEYRGKANPLST